MSELTWNEQLARMTEDRLDEIDYSLADTVPLGDWQICALQVDNGKILVVRTQ